MQQLAVFTTGLKYNFLIILNSLNDNKQNVQEIFH